MPRGIPLSTILQCHDPLLQFYRTNFEAAQEQIQLLRNRIRFMAARIRDTERLLARDQATNTRLLEENIEQDQQLQALWNAITENLQDLQTFQNDYRSHYAHLQELNDHTVPIAVERNVRRRLVYELMDTDSSDSDVERIEI